MGESSRGKAVGQIDKLKNELERNARLFNVFSICLELGVDDPIHWMNNTSSVIVDWWVAYKQLKFEIESKAYDSSSNNKEVSVEEAGTYLSSLIGKK